MALLPVIVLLALRRQSLAADIGELAAAVTLALLANAFVCGALSNPHDRYGARMVWLAGLAVASPWRWPDRTATPQAFGGRRALA